MALTIAALRATDAVAMGKHLLRLAPPQRDVRIRFVFS